MSLFKIIKQSLKNTSLTTDIMFVTVPILFPIVYFKVIKGI